MTGKGILHRNDRLVCLGQGDRYRLIRLVAEDSLGQVWHSEDTSLRAPVTIRIVDDSLTVDRARLSSVRRELSGIYARLAHPNIAWVYYYNDGEDGPVEFVVMENLRGQTLAQRLRRGPSLKPGEGFGIAAAIAEGLQAAHDVGLAHGALTVDSVMVHGGDSVKIMDFGLAELRPRAEGEPEGPAEDVRALGTLLREMSGVREATAGDRRPGVGAKVLRVWQASLDPDPAARPTAEVLARALRDVAEHGAVPEAPSARPAGESIREPEGPLPAQMLRTDGPSGPESAPPEPLTEQSVPIAAVEEVDEAGHAEEATVLPDAAGEAIRLAEAARTEEKAAGGEAARRAAQLQRAEEAVRRLEARSQEAATRGRGAATHLERARAALDEAETEHLELSRAMAQAEEVAQKEDQRRKEAILRAEEAARRAEAARAAAADAESRKAGAAERVRTAGELARAEESRGAEAAKSLAAAIQQRDEARDASRDAGAEHDRMVEAARVAEDVARRARGGRAPEPAAVDRVGEPAHTRRARPPRRTWLGMMALTMATALLVFLVARQDPEPSIGNGRGSPPATEPLVMPDLRGLTYDEALLRLEEMDLVLSRRIKAQGESAVVVATDPGLGHLVRPGTEVTVFVGADSSASEGP